MTAPNEIQLSLEAIIFAATESVTVQELQLALEKTNEISLSLEEIESHLTNIQQKFQTNSFAFNLVKMSNGYQFLTHSAYHKAISVYLNQKMRKSLSNATLETLSIIAYKQPITKVIIEEIRGVNCDYAIQKLLEKELISIAGRSKSIGKPLLYATSKQFMDYFGLESMNDLPQLKEILPDKNEIGLIDENAESSQEKD
ncbi:MAG: SMC-Scp complex subunit ScpB [Chitinophagales bacterium]|nr:SMC-Scp complex subunit ScpB [Bacteroidota bacterium]MCB9043971.1 SMC-Scp complex subunit ScpB [Chitinophagales bacterium]